MRDCKAFLIEEASSQSGSPVLHGATVPTGTKCIPPAPLVFGSIPTGDSTVNYGASQVPRRIDGVLGARASEESDWRGRLLKAAIRRRL